MSKVSRIQLASGVNAMLGSWLVASPWALAFLGDQLATGNTILLGVVIATLGAARAYGAYRATWLSWANAIFGGWLVAAPFALAYSIDSARLNSVLTGLAVLALAIWSARLQPAAFRQ